MSTVTATASSTSTSTTGTTTTGNDLGRDDFLRLLVGRLQHQNPLQPTGDQEFIGQMAQFAMLDQLSALADSTNRIAGALQRSGATSLIGRTVRYQDASGATVEGVVEKVTVDRGEATLTVGGVGGIDPEAVREVS